MMVICIKQHLSNIWSSIYEKVKQHWGRVEKSVAYKKKACIYMKQTKRNSKIQTTMFFYPRGKFTLKSVHYFHLAFTCWHQSRPETYSEPCEISKMKLFVKTFNGFQLQTVAFIV